jgi:glycosyltransferase involved in cell wall biosynthesis
MLSKKQLLSLYRKADFGMVASMSNVSLVPYEMLATGLPLIEFEDGTFPYFLP